MKYDVKVKMKTYKLRGNDFVDINIKTLHWLRTDPVHYKLHISVCLYKAYPKKIAKCNFLNHKHTHGI